MAACLLLRAHHCVTQTPSLQQRAANRCINSPGLKDCILTPSRLDKQQHSSLNSSHSRRISARAAATDMPLLQGKTALITGASRGIGRAIALRMAKEGATLALAARNEAMLKDVASECKKAGSPDCHVFPVDLSKPEALAGFVKDVGSRVEGSVDILVNNAGVMPAGDTAAGEGDYAAWLEAIHLNLYTPWVLTDAFVPAMAQKKYGRILNIASIAGTEPMPGTPIYSSTKWGLRGYSHSCYSALRNKGIGVVTINPPAVETDMTEGRGFKKDKILDPEDIAETCMLVFNTGPNCVPQDLTLQLGLSAM